MSWINRVLLNLIVIAVSTAITLAISLIILLQFNYTEYGRQLATISYASLFDTEYTYRRLKSDINVTAYTPWGSPFNISTDNNGLRNSSFISNIALKKSFYVYGDSQTFGYGINDEDTITSHLNRISSKNQGSAVFFNRGVSGIGLEEILNQIEADISTGLVTKESSVFVNVYINDVIDATHPASARASFISGILSKNNKRLTKIQYLKSVFAQSLYKLLSGNRDYIGYAGDPLIFNSNLPEAGILIEPLKINEQLAEKTKNSSQYIKSIRLFANNDECIDVILYSENQAVKESMTACVNQGYNDVAMKSPWLINHNDKVFFYDKGLETIAQSNEYKSYKKYNIGPVFNKDSQLTDSEGNLAVELNLSNSYGLDFMSSISYLRKMLSYYSSESNFSSFFKKGDIKNCEDFEASDLEKVYCTFYKIVDIKNCEDFEFGNLGKFYCTNNDFRSSFYDSFRSQVDTINYLALENDIKLSMFFLPSIYECIFHEKYRNNLGITYAAFRAPFESILDGLSSNQYKIVPDYVQNCQFVLQDTHFNEVGTELIAKQVYKILEIDDL